jgi:pyruvate dehydrogenase E1 component alpha subunit
MQARATAFGIHAEKVDGQDVRAVYDKAKAIVERTRAGAGPAFLLCDTYRFHGHHVGDISREYYRSKQEEQLWKTQRDPLKLLGDWLIAQNLATRSVIDQIEAEVRSEVEQAVEFAVAAPYPSPDKVDQDIYA